MIKLLNPPCIIMRQILINLGLASLPGDGRNWPCYFSNMPDGSNVADDVITVYDTAGVKDYRVQRGDVSEKLGINLRLRSLTYENGWEKGEAIRDEIDRFTPGTVVQVGANFYDVLNIIRSTVPIFNGFDDKRRRSIFTINFLIILRIQV